MTESRGRLRFSLVPFDWRPWTSTVADGEATAEQWGVLDDVVPTMKANPYYLLLAHDPEPLRQRQAVSAPEHKSSQEYP